MLGQQGSASLTSPSGACLELTQIRCARYVCVRVYLYAFLKGKTLKAVTVPEMLSNKLICCPFFLPFCTQQFYISPGSDQK